MSILHCERLGSDSDEMKAPPKGGGSVIVKRMEILAVQVPNASAPCYLKTKLKDGTVKSRSSAMGPCYKCTSHVFINYE